MLQANTAASPSHKALKVFQGKTVPQDPLPSRETLSGSDAQSPLGRSVLTAVYHWVIKHIPLPLFFKNWDLNDWQTQSYSLAFHPFILLPKEPRVLSFLYEHAIYIFFTKIISPSTMIPGQIPPRTYVRNYEIFFPSKMQGTYLLFIPIETDYCYFETVNVQES